MLSIVFSDIYMYVSEMVANALCGNEIHNDLRNIVLFLNDYKTTRMYIAV